MKQANGSSDRAINDSKSVLAESVAESDDWLVVVIGHPDLGRLSTDRRMGLGLGRSLRMAATDRHAATAGQTNVA